MTNRRTRQFNMPKWSCTSVKGRGSYRAARRPGYRFGGSPAPPAIDSLRHAGPFRCGLAAGRNRFKRRGFTVLLVLALLSITLALSYAMMRSQTVSSQIQGNLSYGDNARQAAHAGLAIALREMHEADWQGVDSVVAGRLSVRDSYRVTFQTGDDSLDPEHPQYADYPFRVTLVSTGASVNPDDAGIRAEHQIKAVAQLVRRQLSAEPPNWQRLQQTDDGTPYTIYQWMDEDVPIEVPVRVEGAVRLQGSLKLGTDYDWVDNRPFDGLIDEVAVFGHALAEEQLQAIHAAGHGSGSLSATYAANSPSSWWRLDETAGATVARDRQGNHDGTYVGPNSGDTGLPLGGNGAARFDGYNDYIDLGPMDLSGNQLTLVAWFKADSFDDQTDARILSKTTGTSVSDHYWMLGTCLKGRQIRLRFRLRTGGGTTQLEAPMGNILTGTWVFAAAVYDGAKMRLYKDGVLVGETSKSGNVATNPMVSAWIGDNPPGSIRARYLRDLERMRASGDGDYRPLTGPVYLPRSRSSEPHLSLVEDDLNVAVHDIPATNSAPLTHPGSVLTYRLYPGGREYTIPTLPSDPVNVIYEPDPLGNPLGVFRRGGSVTFRNNVSITGTVVTSSGGDIRVSGDNVSLKAFDLPALDSGPVVQLPVALAADDIRVYSPQQSSIRGLAIAWGDFEAQKNSEDTKFDYSGRVIARDLELYARNEWDMRASIWMWLIKGFMSQLYDPSGAGHSTFFPRWLGGATPRAPEPLITITPDAEAPSYHWQDWDQPVYVPHPDDEGLVWDLVEWTDNP